MRIIPMMCALVVAACAGQPSTPPPPTRYITASGQTAASVSDVDLDAKRLAEAKKGGYTLTNTDGEVLYCRADLKTGSHVQNHTNCLTATELDDMHDQTRQGLQNLLKPQPSAQLHSH